MKELILKTLHKQFMADNKATIPDKSREEWRKIVTGEIEHQFKNFVLQMKSSDYKFKIESNELTVSEAVNELYSLCEKYALAVQDDFKQIFKEW